MAIDVRAVFDDVRAELQSDVDSSDSILKADVFDAVHELANYMIELGQPVDKVVANPEKNFMRILLKSDSPLDMKALTFKFDQWSAGSVNVEMGFMEMPKQYKFDDFNIYQDSFDDDMTRAARSISRLILQTIARHYPEQDVSPS